MTAEDAGNASTAGPKRRPSSSQAVISAVAGSSEWLATRTKPGSPATRPAGGTQAGVRSPAARPADSGP